MIPIAIAAVVVAAHTTSGIQTLSLLYTIAGILTGVSIIGVAITKYIWPFSKRFFHMVMDWGGEEARPGVPARPGVMVRLENLEVGQIKMTSDISSIKHEVHMNSGQSIKDIAIRTEKRVEDLHERVDELEENRVTRDGRETS